MRTVLGSAVVVLVLTAAWCVQGAGSEPAEGVEVGGKALDFTLKALDGTEVKLSAFQGKKGVVVDFFASWCPPCRKGIPHLVAFNKKFADKDIVVLGVNVREKPDKVEAFVKEIGIDYTVLLDATAAVTQQYRVQGIPTYIGIDKNGIIRHRDHAMPADEDAFVKALTK